MQLSKNWVKMLTIFVVFLTFSMRFHYGFSHESVKQRRIHIDVSSSIGEVHEFSPSVAVGMGLFSHKWIRYLNHPKLITLVKALGPSYLRMGGTKSDYSHFVDDSTLSDTMSNSAYRDRYRDCSGSMPTAANFKQHLKDVSVYVARDDAIFRVGDFTSFNIIYTASDFDDFMEFVSCSGMKLIFGLNFLERTGQTWNPANTLNLLAHAKQKKYRIDWELGNEPNSYRHSAGVTISPKQLAQDFTKLNDILKEDDWWRESMIYGPDANSMFKAKNRKYLKKFLGFAGEYIGATTFHQYYINSVNATQDNFTDYKILNDLRGLINSVVSVIRQDMKTLPIWIGETSSSYGGGADGLSNSYVAGFMWLDKLGIAAINGIDLVFRQTLIEGHYAMIDNNFDPYPDYWLTLLYKSLVGSTVLNVTVFSASHSDRVRNDGRFRVYAHCTNTHRTDYEDGAVTIYYLNLLPSERSLTIESNGARSPTTAMTYILTSAQGNLTSKEVYLNGKELQMINMHTMPPLTPNTIDLQSEQVILPKTSFGFVVLPDAKAPACSQN